SEHDYRVVTRRLKRRRVVGPSEGRARRRDHGAWNVPPSRMSASSLQRRPVGASQETAPERTEGSQYGSRTPHADRVPRGKNTRRPMRIGIILDWMNPNIERAVRLLSERGVKLDLMQVEIHLSGLSRVRGIDYIDLLTSVPDLAS